MTDETPAAEPICRSCRIRFKVAQPNINDDYAAWSVNVYAFRWIENAARDFDRQADGKKYTAEEFIAWIKPDVIGQRTRDYDTARHREREERTVSLPEFLRGVGG